jgi:hypothetical protein
MTIVFNDFAINQNTLCQYLFSRWHKETERKLCDFVPL